MIIEGKDTIWGPAGAAQIWASEIWASIE